MLVQVQTSEGSTPASTSEGSTETGTRVPNDAQGDRLLAQDSFVEVCFDHCGRFELVRVNVKEKGRRLPFTIGEDDVKSTPLLDWIECASLPDILGAERAGLANTQFGEAPSQFVCEFRAILQERP